MTGSDFTDVRYEVDGAVAIITINRPERMNAFRGRTVDELIAAFRAAWADSAVARGRADRRRRPGLLRRRRPEAAGRDRRLRPDRERASSRSSGLHRLIRAIPKPVIAAVNGFAIGGGHVLHVLCDLTVASETARFGQSGPARRLVRRRLRQRLPGPRRR